MLWKEWRVYWLQYRPSDLLFPGKSANKTYDFYVDPTVRGRGIGRMLLDAIFDEAVSTKCCKLTLEVQQNNSRARSIYGKFGFTQAVYAADSEGGGSLPMVKTNLMERSDEVNVGMIRLQIASPGVQDAKESQLATRQLPATLIFLEVDQTLGARC